MLAVSKNSGLLLDPAEPSVPEAEHRPISQLSYWEPFQEDDLSFSMAPDCYSITRVFLLSFFLSLRARPLSTISSFSLSHFISAPLSLSLSRPLLPGFLPTATMPSVACSGPLGLGLPRPWTRLLRLGPGHAVALIRRPVPPSLRRPSKNWEIEKVGGEKGGRVA